MHQTPSGTVDQEDFKQLLPCLRMDGPWYLPRHVPRPTLPPRITLAPGLQDRIRYYQPRSSRHDPQQEEELPTPPMNQRPRRPPQVPHLPHEVSVIQPVLAEQYHLMAMMNCDEQGSGAKKESPETPEEPLDLCVRHMDTAEKLNNQEEIHLAKRLVRQVDDDGNETRRLVKVESRRGFYDTESFIHIRRKLF